MSFTLGQQVTFTHALERRREYVRAEGPADSWSDVGPGYERKWWEAVKRDAVHDLCRGVITGRRTLADGENHGYGYIQFHPTRRFRAWLVVGALDLNPWLVLPEHLEPPEPDRPAPDPDEVCRRAQWCRRALADPSLEVFR
jgi:hypothetical protein